MSASRLPDDQFWRQLVDHLDQGVIVFDDREAVVYANNEAARLIGYPPQDVLGLDKDDFLSLCQADRLDIASLSRALRGRQAASSAQRSYQVVTAEGRLEVTPLALAGPHGPVTVLLLRESIHWRSEIIAQTVIGEMNSPLSFASSYCDTLLHQLTQGWVSTFELRDLARIIRDSVKRALWLWEMLAGLYSTDPEESARWVCRPIDLAAALRAALRELSDQAVQGVVGLRLAMPDDLPPVSASASHLHTALCALLSGAAARLTSQERLIVKARARQSYVQVDLIPEAVSGAFHPYQFDMLPLAVVEQVIARHGGRLWFSETPGQPSGCSFSLPVWKEDQAVELGR